jgi:enoyl-CoA hydratase/carnithine racemase
MQGQHDYLAAYRSLKLTRDSEGVLVAEFHSKGGPFTFTAQDHTEFVDAFYRIAQDRANKIVILTGAGGGAFPSRSSWCCLRYSAHAFSSGWV